MPHTAEKEHVAKIKPGITNPSPKYQNSMEKLTKNPHRQSIEKDETKLPHHHHHQNQSPIVHLTDRQRVNFLLIAHLARREENASYTYTLAGEHVCALLLENTFVVSHKQRTDSWTVQLLL